MRNLAAASKPLPFDSLRSRKPGRSARQIFLLVGLAVAAAFLSQRPARAGDDAPPWLRQAAASTIPALAKDVPAVVLAKERRVTVDEAGKVVTTNIFAVKILTREGRDAAVAHESYVTDSGKVRDMRAWLIRPSGDVKKYGKDETVDIALADNDVYNEVRARVIVASSSAEPGAVFGYEATTEERSVFTQFDWEFQDELPTLVSRFSLTVPRGWKADGVTFNHAAIQPTVSGSTYTWEMRDLPYIEDEPMRPALTNIAPRLEVGYFPPEGVKAGLGKAFENWADVSRWLSDLSDPQMTLDDNLAGKAKQLTAGATSELEKIQRIGRYVQGTNYVAIQTGIGRGGGYRPHPATEVFSKNYGDCKDKANLMRAMLKAVGIQGYLVSIWSGDPTYVRQEWPSPQQFNHCIIAVKVGDQTEAPTVINHPKLGRLLIFDPTSTNTPVGDLPDYEQGSFALIVAGDAGGLARMPVTPPEANRLERDAEVTLGPDGTITASLRENSLGQSAVGERREFRGRSRADYEKAIETWITRGASGASISKVEPADDAAAGKFALLVEFTAPHYAQLMQNRLLVFKPAIVSRRETLSLTSGIRRHPVVLESRAYSETVKVKLPAGFDVDELPDPVKIDASFGSYETAYEAKDGQLRFKRKLIVRPGVIPVAEYPQVRSFFERIRAAEQSPVVLAKK